MEDLIQTFLKQNLLDLLVSNLGRFNDDPLDPTLPEDEKASKEVQAESDTESIYHTLRVIENLITFSAQISETLISSTTFLHWILTRIAERTEAVDQNTAYAAELLAIMLQSSESNRDKVGANEIGKEGESGIDILLATLARFRRKAPSDAEEEEFVENIFDSLCLCLSQPPNKAIFLDGEGVELMVLLMKEKKSFGRVRAVKVLNHATSGPAGSEVCKRLIDAGGLSPLFGVFMDCNSEEGRKGKKKGRATVALSDAEHILGVLASLFTHLESESIERIRLLAKFVGEGYEKVDHLLDLRDALTSRLDTVASTANNDDDEEEDEEERYLNQLELGLFSLQLLGTILAWIVMEDDAVRDHVAGCSRGKGWGGKT